MGTPHVYAAVFSFRRHRYRNETVQYRACGVAWPKKRRQCAVYGDAAASSMRALLTSRILRDRLRVGDADYMFGARNYPFGPHFSI